MGLDVHEYRLVPSSREELRDRRGYGVEAVLMAPSLARDMRCSRQDRWQDRVGLQNEPAAVAQPLPQRDRGAIESDGALVE